MTPLAKLAVTFWRNFQIRSLIKSGTLELTKQSTSSDLVLKLGAGRTEQNQRSSKYAAEINDKWNNENHSDIR